MDDTELKAKIKSVIIENLMLQLEPDEIANDEELFGPEGLGLDSVDALQLVVALDKNFGLKLADAAAARDVLKDVNHIAEAVKKVENSPA